MVASFIPLRSPQRPSLTPLDPGGRYEALPTETTASRRPAFSRELKARLVRAVVLGGTLLSSVYLTLHLTLPDDHAFRGTLLLPYDPLVLASTYDVDFWSPTAPQPNYNSSMTDDDDGRADTAGWSLPNLTEPALRRNYRIFQPSAQPDYSAVGAGIQPVEILPDNCLEKWLGRGEACEPEEVADKAGELDIVWTWVNGSDPAWHEHFSHYADPNVTSLPQGWGVPPIRHYRNKDELRHSLRSVFKSMGIDRHVRTFHLVLGDWALGAHATPVVKEYFRSDWSAHRALEQGREWRAGQMPEWLDANLLGLERAGLSVKVHHHAEIFKDRTAVDEEAALRYRSEALPNFNSFAIEGQLVNIPGLAPHFVYFNDDFFLTRKHSKADYYTPLFGPVLGFVFPAWVTADEFPATACVHEWSAMLRSNWVFGHRFGHRKRMGLQHIPKVFSRAALEESAQVWAADFAHSSRRRFREVERGPSEESRVGDLHATWMANELMVERSRESLLWTWAVARLGGLDGTWSTAARDEVASLFNVSLSTAGVRDGPIAAFNRNVRDTLVWETLSASFKAMGLGGPMTTQYLWASYDGGLPHNHRKAPGPDTARLDVCFGPFWTMGVDVSAVEMFERVGFVHHACGDQILAALINRSGPNGLSALLPPPGLSISIANSDRLPQAIQPHMPLTKTWRATDFNLRAVVRWHEEQVDLRTWCLRLIARYQYTSGESEYQFTMVIHPSDIDSARKIDTPGSRISSLAINDDIEGDEADEERSVEAIKSFLRTEWPEPGWWERPQLTEATPV